VGANERDEWLRAAWRTMISTLDAQRLVFVDERVRQQIEIAFASLKRVFGLGETLVTALMGLATRIAAKITAYTYAFLVNRRLGRPQGRIKELWS
jgi:hypothetical protein